MADNKFHYLIGDVDIALPQLANVPLGIVRKTRHLPDDEKLFVTLETLLPEGSPELAAVDTLDRSGLADLMGAWQAAAGVDLGESSAS